MVPRHRYRSKHTKHQNPAVSRKKNSYLAQIPMCDIPYIPSASIICIRVIQARARLADVGP